METREVIYHCVAFGLEAYSAISFIIIGMGIVLVNKGDIDFKHPFIFVGIAAITWPIALPLVYLIEKYSKTRGLTIYMGLVY